MMSGLASRECVPCKSGTPPLEGEFIAALLAQLDHDWKVVDDHHLEKEYRFPNFLQALAYTNRIGGLAEAVGHHPDIHLAWGKVRLTLWTHSINGLSESDFIFAAKADAVL
jgi:4a-hydroxytetrahydrobiopterin dehydratase